MAVIHVKKWFFMEVGCCLLLPSLYIYGSDDDGMMGMMGRPIPGIPMAFPEFALLLVFQAVSFLCKQT